MFCIATVWIDLLALNQSQSVLFWFKHCIPLYMFQAGNYCVICATEGEGSSARWPKWQWQWSAVHWGKILTENIHPDLNILVAHSSLQHNISAETNIRATDTVHQTWAASSSQSQGQLTHTIVTKTKKKTCISNIHLLLRTTKDLA